MKGMVKLVALVFFLGPVQGLTRAETPVLPPLKDRFKGDQVKEEPHFQRHIVPLLGRLGCNGRSCHGSFQGRGGFRLSMFGYDFAADHEALTGGKRPRVDLKNPEKSLILRKPTGEEEHGGKVRFDFGGWEYRVLRRWIAAGARNDAHSPSPLGGEGGVRGTHLSKLEVSPSEIIFAQPKKSVQLQVIAHWSDGTREDVTCLTRFASTDEGVVEVNSRGLAQALDKGAGFIIASYDNGVTPVPVMLPVSDKNGVRYPEVPAPTQVDGLVLAKLRKLGIVPSEPSDDAQFLRRVSLDLAGTLPAPQEVAAFLKDPRADRRARKIDELLQTPEHAVWWTNKLCDLTGLNPAAQLGNTDYAPQVGDQWFNWIYRRVRENRGYDEIVKGIVLAVSRKPGQKYDDFVMEQVSYMRKKDPVDFTLQPWMPYFWFRDNLARAEDKALAFSYAFLGVRLDCAQCHKHPFDQWSQQDFQDFTAFFERIGKGVAPDAAADKKKLEERLDVAKLNTAAIRRLTFRKWAMDGQPAPFREIFIMPVPGGKKPPTMKLLGGRQVELAPNQDPREPLLAWLLEKDNPYFARAFVNRVWAHYFGVGIVHPPDDFNLANPPSNRELLDYLAQGFVKQGYDMKWLHRQIANSRTYQLGWKTNDTNRLDDRFFSRALIRQLPAEVAMDAILQATARAAEPLRDSAKVSATALPGPVLKKRFIASHPAAYERAMDYSLLIFGKPLRKTNCDCERKSEPSLLQAVYLRNDADMRKKMHRPDGWLKNLPKKASVPELIQEAYVRTLSRPPTEVERARCQQYFENAPTHEEALEDILWAIFNTKEFITNH